MEVELLNFLAGAGDVGIWVLIVVVWKFDRRLFQLELNFKNHIEKAG